MVDSWLQHCCYNRLYGALYHSIISSFRWLAVGFSIAAIIFVVQILDNLHLDRSNKLQENTSIPTQDHQYLIDIETIRAKGVKVSGENRTLSVNRGGGNCYWLPCTINFIERILHKCSCFINLLNELGKSDLMRGWLSILLLFRSEFNKFNKTGARMLDSIYHMAVNILTNCIFGVKTSRFSFILRNVIMDVITFPENL